MTTRSIVPWAALATAVLTMASCADPLTEEDLSLYEWEVTQVIHRVDSHGNGSIWMGIETNSPSVSTYYRDFECTESIGAAELILIAGVPLRDQHEIIASGFSGTSGGARFDPPIDSSIITDLEFDTETVFFAAEDSSLWQIGGPDKAIAKIRFATDRVQIQYR